MGHVSYSEEINATPEQVWAVISEATRLPEWAYDDGRYPYPVEAHYGTDQHEGVGTIWVGVSADGQKATQKVTAWEPGQKLVYELEAIENAPMEMTQVNTFALKATAGGTQVTWSVDWSIASGFSLNKLLVRFTGDGAFEEMIAGSLENLKDLIENEKVRVIEGEVTD